MNTRIHPRSDGKYVLQKQNVGVEKGPQWTKCAGPYGSIKRARQGQIRYEKEREFDNWNSLVQQVVSKNWGDVKIKR